MKYILMTLILMNIIACGNPEKSLGLQKTTVLKLDAADAEQYTYKFRGLKSCTTEKHSDSTFEGICETLADDDLNNNCAEAKRLELFENSECPGSFF